MVVRLGRTLLAAPPDEVAPLLLGATFSKTTADGRAAVRITEVEAYGGTGSDAASHPHGDAPVPEGSAHVSARPQLPSRVAPSLAVVAGLRNLPVRAAGSAVAPVCEISLSAPAASAARRRTRTAPNSCPAKLRRAKPSRSAGFSPMRT